MEEKPKVNFLYRYVLEHWCGTTKLSLRKFKVTKETEKGYWIEIHYNRKKWVSNFARNRWAQPSKREALKHYIRRKMYRNHCIMEEMARNDVTIIKAKELLKEHDKQGKK